MSGGIKIDGLQDFNVKLQTIVQQLSAIYTAINNLAVGVTADNTFTGSNSFTKPIQLAIYTVATLPAVVLGDVGSVAFASNGRNTGEGGGNGTGCLVQVQNKAGTATWCAIWSGVAVTA